MRRFRIAWAHVQHKRMIDKLEIVLLGDLLLATLNNFIHKLENFPAFQANDVVMVFLLGHLEQRMPAVEIMPYHKASRLELSQHPVYGGQPHILTRINQGLVDFFGAQVILARSVFENLQDFYPRQGHF